MHHWKELLEGKSISIEMIVIKKFDFYRFQGKIIQRTPDKIIIEVSPLSEFLKLFLKPILLTYKLKDKSLLTYTGLSNLSLAGKSSREVVITYENLMTNP